MQILMVENLNYGTSISFLSVITYSCVVIVCCYCQACTEQIWQM